MSKERNISETPDKWVVIKIDNNLDKPHYKVFATWAGNRWKLSSSIISVESDDDYYYFIGYSESCYKCHKKAYGTATMHGEDVLMGMIKHTNRIDTTLNVLPKDTEWKELLNQNKDE